VAAEQFAGRGRCTGARVEQSDTDFAFGKRAVDERQVADDTGEEAKAEAGFGDDKGAREVASRDDIAKAESEESGAAEIDVGPETGSGRNGNVDRGTSTVLHESEAVDQANGPDGDQDQQRDGTEDAEGGFADFFGRDELGERFPQIPEIFVEKARETEAARDAAREDDDLEGVPYDDDEDGDAGCVSGGECQHGRDCTCLKLSCAEHERRKKKQIPQAKAALGMTSLTSRASLLD